jgi:splicing factor 3B subunit 1
VVRNIRQALHCGAEFVPAREWMRICFELLEMLKATKKAIRRATVNTFGYIAKAGWCTLQA